MATDAERREIARRLRDRLKTDGIGGFTSGEFGNAVYFSVMHGHRGGYGEAGSFLADLIEPSEPKVKCVAEVKVDGERLEQLARDAAVELTGIDRDALLVEVKELERCAWYFGLDFDEDEPLRDRLEEASEDFAGSAGRIRKALGVDDG